MESLGEYDISLGKRPPCGGDRVVFDCLSHHHCLTGPDNRGCKRTGLSVSPAVLAGTVEVRSVMTVFDRRHPEISPEDRDNPLDSGCLSTVPVACHGNDNWLNPIHADSRVSIACYIAEVRITMGCLSSHRLSRLKRTMAASMGI